MSRSFALLALLAVGCRNAVYYSETDRVALAIEQKPDIAQPVAFNFGFKQRVVAVVPPKRDGANEPGDVPDDAVSVISRFDFDYEDGNWLNNPTLVQSALITGQAARQLKGDKATQAAEAVSSTSAGTRTYAFTAMSLAYDRMEFQAGDATLSASERQSASKYLAAARTEGARLLIGLQPFDSRTFGSNVLTDPELVAPPVPDQTSLADAFDQLLVYRGKLDKTVGYLRDWARAQAEPVNLDSAPFARAGQNAAEERKRIALWTEARRDIELLNALDAKAARAPGLTQLVSALDTQIRTGSLPEFK